MFQDPLSQLKAPESWSIPIGANTGWGAWTWALPSNAKFAPLDYGVNPNVMAVSATSLAQPASTILLSDAANFDAFGGLIGETSMTDGLAGGETWLDPFLMPNGQARHGDKGEVAWADGHAKAMNVTYRDVPYYFSTVEQEKALGLGDFLPAGCGSDDPKCRYFYYAISGAVSSADGAIVK